MIVNIVSNTLNVQPRRQWPYLSGTCPTGQLRFINGDLEAFDGSTWKVVSSPQQVELSFETQTVIEWAKKKMIEEQQIKELAATYTTVADALEDYKKAEEKLMVIVNLCKST